MPTIPGYADFVEVGRGGFAVVYRARQETVDREVAVKVISERGADETAVRRFKQECRAAGTLSWHQHIVVVYDAGVTADGFPFLSMEYLPAGSLEDRLEKEGPFPWSSATGLILQVADALHTAHIAEMLHRDLKPANILIGRSGQAKLADFGIVSIAGALRTRSGEFMATVAYAAPEILAGDPASPASDQYSLAATLYTLIAGAPAFVKHTDESIGPIVMRTLSEDPPNLAEQGLPGSASEVVRRAMAKDPTDRFPSVEAFGSALRNTMPGTGSALPSDNRSSANSTRPAAAQPPPLEDELSAGDGRRRPRFSKAVVRLLIAAVVVVGSATAWFVRNGERPDELTAGEPSKNMSTVAPATTSVSQAPTSLTTDSTIAQANPDDPASYYTTDGTSPSLNQECNGLLGFCLGTPVERVVARLGVETERREGVEGELVRRWDFDDMGLTVGQDGVGGIAGITLAIPAMEGPSEPHPTHRVAAPGGLILGDMVLDDAVDAFGTPEAYAFYAENVIVVSYVFRVGPEGSETLDFSHIDEAPEDAPDIDDPSVLHGRFRSAQPTSLTVAYLNS